MIDDYDDGDYNGDNDDYVDDDIVNYDSNTNDDDASTTKTIMTRNRCQSLVRCLFITKFIPYSCISAMTGQLVSLSSPA